MVEKTVVYYLWRGEESWMLGRDLEDPVGVPLPFPWFSPTERVLSAMRGQHPSYQFEIRAWNTPRRAWFDELPAACPVPTLDRRGW